MARMKKELGLETLANVTGGEAGKYDQQALKSLMDSIKEKGGTLKDAITVWRSTYHSDPEIMNQIRYIYCRNRENVRLAGSVV